MLKYFFVSTKICCYFAQTLLQIMNKTLSNLIFILTISIVLISCANRGRPTGGEKDKLPPSILKSVPENYATNFTGKEINLSKPACLKF